MKHGWEYTNFGDIISPAKNLRNSDGAVLPVLSITMHGGIVKQNERFKKVIASRDTANYKVVKRGQLVIAFPIDEGLIYTQEVADKGIMSPAYNVYDIDCTNINRHFLVTFLHSPFAMKYYKDKLRGTTQRRRMLPKEDLYALSIPLPPLPVQEQICSLLDNLNLVIEKKKVQIAELDNLAQSLFYDMFGNPILNDKGWEVKTIGEVCKSKNNIIRANKYFDNSDRIDYIDISSINNALNLIISTTSYIFSDAPSRAQQKVEKDDLLVSLVRPNLKNIALVDDIKTSLVASSGFCVLRTSLVIPQYLKYLVITKEFTEYLCKRVCGINYPAVKENDIKDCPIGVPPLSLQKAFAEKVQAIERQKELINQSIKDVQTLFDAKMDYYFGD